MEERPFEFSDHHKESFAALAGSVIFLGVCALLFACVSVMGALGALVEGYPVFAAGATIGALLHGIAAVWMLSAGRSLAGMLRTRGKDVELLMQAVAQLRRLFALVMAMTLLVVAGGMAALWCVTSGGKCFAFLN
jgi:hypothetical protein